MVIEAHLGHQHLQPAVDHQAPNPIPYHLPLTTYHPHPQFPAITTNCSRINLGLSSANRGGEAIKDGANKLLTAKQKSAQRKTVAI